MSPDTLPAKVDLARDTAGLPPSLVAEMETAGGLWWASDAYTTAAGVIAAVRRHGIVALRLDFRDLGLLAELPEIRYLHVRSDGRPRLESVAGLRNLRALVIHTGALRGELDPLAFEHLEWLRIGLGGKGGAAAAEALARGHRRLRWLSLREVKARVATDVCAGFPVLRVLRIGYADHLRELGLLTEASPLLEKLALELTGIRSLEGLAGLDHLETIEIFGGRVTDLTPLRSLRRLRYARLELPDLASIEPLRDHPLLRMLSLTMALEPDPSVLGSLPNLAAVLRGRGFEQPVRWPDLKELPEEHPLREEWVRVMRE